LPYRHSTEQDEKMAIIYELQEIELIPFEDVTLRKGDIDSPGLFGEIEAPDILNPQSLEF